MNIVIFHRFLPFPRVNRINNSQVSMFSKKAKESPIPVNPLKKFYGSSEQPQNGVVYDTKPFKIRCEAGKVYNWCLCGQSKGQPFCDGTHRNIHLKIKLRPIKFTVTETKDYWLCNCKQTSNRPFCDGTHKKEEFRKYNR